MTYIPDNKWDTVMTIKEYFSCVALGGFIDYDGYGYPGNGVEFDDERTLYPSDGRKKVLPTDTHVVWFNR